MSNQTTEVRTQEFIENFYDKLGYGIESAQFDIASAYGYNIDCSYDDIDITPPDKNPERDYFAFMSAKLLLQREVGVYVSRNSVFYGRCESPIERMFALALQAVSESEYVGEWFYVIGDGDLKEAEKHHSSIAIEPQVVIDKYRVDFLIRRYGVIVKYNKETGPYLEGFKKQIIVECDGHDFHERTKEQAAKDRSKDRKLQSLGYKIYRFTGSEIWRDPIKCATELLNEITEDPKEGKES